MKRLGNSVGALLAAAILIGCGSRSDPGGGATKDNQFTLKGPGSITVDQGGSKTETIKINRGKNFKQAVKLTADTPPTGLKVEVDPATVDASKEEAKITVTAANDAPAGDHNIKIVGTPAEKGDPTHLDFKAHVKARSAEAAAMTISGPLLEPKIKQGDTQTLDLTLKRGSNKSGVSALKAEPQGKGVTAEFAAPALKTDETAIKLKVTAAKDAELGEHTIRITGTPETGALTPYDLKVKVIAP